MRTLASLAAALVLAGCKLNSPDHPLLKSEAAPSITSASEVIATVRFLEVEGGCWALETPQGLIEPLALPPQFQSDGMRVTVTLREAPDVMSACQVGPLREVVSISAD